MAIKWDERSDVRILRIGHAEIKWNEPLRGTTADVCVIHQSNQIQHISNERKRIKHHTILKHFKQPFQALQKAIRSASNGSFEAPHKSFRGIWKSISKCLEGGVSNNAS